MSADFLEGDFDLPAPDEPSDDVAGINGEIGGKEGLRLEFAGRIADQEPADGHWLDAAAIPQRGAAGDLDEAVGPAVPLTDATALPRDPAILDDGGELLLWFSLDRRSATPLARGRREVEQIGIHAQASDDADMLAHGGQEFERRKGAVGHQDDGSIGKPAADLQGGLASPIKQGLGLPWLAGIEAFGGSEHGEE